MSVSSPARACACSATAQAQLATELAATQLQSALLQAITGLTQLVTQLAAQFPAAPSAADAEPWMEERAVVPATHRCSNDLSPILDELSVEQLRSMLRNYPIDRRSLPAPIERLRRSELIEALNQIQAMDL
jgi:hypothetical protein